MTGRLESAPAAERYFCTLSPLCKRIISNVQTVDTHPDADEWQSSGHLSTNCQNISDVRSLARQPGDGAPSSLLFPADAATAATAQPEWRIGGGATYTAQSDLQSGSGTSGSPLDRPHFDGSIDRPSARGAGDGFDSPALVLGGCSGADGETAGSHARSLRQTVLSRLSRGRRVLLSITRLGRAGADGPVTEQPRRLLISSPEKLVHRAGCTPPQLGPRLPAQLSPAGREAAAATGQGGRPASPPPPPPVQAAVVPIRTGAAHRQSLRASAVPPPPARGHSPPPPQPPPRPQPQPTPPQLKRVLPPVVPARRQSQTPEPRAQGDGSELSPAAAVPQELPPPPPQWTSCSADDARLADDLRGNSTEEVVVQCPRWRGDSEPFAEDWRQDSSDEDVRHTDTNHCPATYDHKRPDPVNKLESSLLFPDESTRLPSTKLASYIEDIKSPQSACSEPESAEIREEADVYSSVLQQPSEVGIKTGFDFLDNW